MAQIPKPLQFNVKTINGKSKDLGDYSGSVVLFVNVASACGLTPQYSELEALHQKYGARGLKILGFPANNFGGQEPGTDGEIKTFCESRFRVTFDMFSKISVIGEDQDPLYAYLSGPNGTGAAPQWNFHKYLMSRDGSVESFASTVKPKDLEPAIERLL